MMLRLTNRAKHIATKVPTRQERGYCRRSTGRSNCIAVWGGDSLILCTQHSRVFSGTSASLPTGSKRPVDNVNDSGAKAYQSYLDTLQQIEQLRAENVRKKSEQMYASWKSATEKDSQVHDHHTKNTGSMIKNKGAGVAIVRTLAKQHRKSTNDSEQDPLDRESQLKKSAKALLFTSADTLRYPPAQVQLANDLIVEAWTAQTNSAISTSINQVHAAMSYYRQAGEQGLSEGWFNLGHFLWSGIDGVIDADIEEALHCFREAILLGDCDAMFFLGAYTLGPFVDDDASNHDNTTKTSSLGPTTDHQTATLRQAMQWIEEAASSGHGGALHYLTTFYLNGFSPLDIPPCGEADFLRRLEAAIHHDKTGDSHFLRGSCYLTGTSWHIYDANKALSDFLVAADLGHSVAAVNAGTIYHKGNSEFRIPSDHQRAFQLYQLAGELGCIEGWRNVVACYATGEGVKQSMETAKYIAETMLRPLSND